MKQRTWSWMIGQIYEPVISTISLFVKWDFKPSKISSGTVTSRVIASLYRTTINCFSAAQHQYQISIASQNPFHPEMPRREKKTAKADWLQNKGKRKKCLVQSTKGKGGDVFCLTHTTPHPLLPCPSRAFSYPRQSRLQPWPTVHDAPIRTRPCYTKKLIRKVPNPAETKKKEKQKGSQESVEQALLLT